MNIIIGGAMRSGKTRLAEALSRALSFSCLASDSLILSLQKVYPGSGIGAQGKSFDELCDVFAPFLENLLFHFRESSNVQYVIDGYFIRPRDIERFGPDCHAMFMGYPSAVPEARLDQMRDYGKAFGCFTNSIDDGGLLERVKRWVEHSRALRKECLQYQVPFLDVIGQDGSFCGVSVQQALNALGFTQASA